MSATPSRKRRRLHAEYSGSTCMPSLGSAGAGRIYTIREAPLLRANSLRLLA